MIIPDANLLIFAYDSASPLHPVALDRENHMQGIERIRYDR